MPKKTSINNQSLAILLASIAGLGLLTPIFLAHCLACGELSSWLVDLLLGPIFIGQFISGNGYFALFIDLLTGDKSPFHFIARKRKPSLPPAPRKWQFKRLLRGETIGLMVGLLGGIGLAALRCGMHTVFPYTGAIGAVCAGIVFFITALGSPSGLGNRLGRVIDHIRYRHQKPWLTLFSKPQVNYILSIVAGIVVGAALVALTFVAPPAGLSVITSVLLAVTLTGTCVSASSYFGRIADVLLGNRTLIHLFTQKTTEPSSSIRERCNKENIGIMLGIVAGLVTASIFIALGVFTLPFFGAGIPKIIAGFALFAFCISAYAGLFGRLGRAIDRFEAHKKEKNAQEEAPISVPSPNTQQLDLNPTVLNVSSETKTENIAFHTEKNQNNAIIKDNYSAHGFLKVNTTSPGKTSSTHLIISSLESIEETSTTRYNNMTPIQTPTFIVTSV